MWEIIREILICQSIEGKIMMSATYFQMTQQKKIIKNILIYMCKHTHTQTDPDMPKCYLLILDGQFMSITTFLYT